MRYYIYESHLGGYYATTEEIPYEYLACDECGDSDQFVFYGTKDELYKQQVKEVLNLRKKIDKCIKNNDTDGVENLKYELEELEYEYSNMFRAFKRLE